MSREPSELPTSDPEPQAAALPEGILTYVDEGPRDAPVVFAVHGVPGSVRDFRYLAPQLCDRVRLVRVDLPGFGGSAPVADALASFSGRARALIRLADHLNVRRFTVLGHSMGGGTGLVAAAEHPDRIEGLVLVSSISLSRHRGLGFSPRLVAAVGHLLRVPLVNRLALPLLRRLYRKRKFPRADQMQPEAFGIHLRALGAADFPRLRRAVAGPLPPTLLVYAHDDHLVETWLSEELARALPGSRVLAFRDGGHNLQKTRAVELARAIQEMLLPAADVSALTEVGGLAR